MPQGGRYSLSRFAKIRLQSAAHFESGKFFILPSAASPSFCSGATYLIFIRTIEALRARGELHLDFATLDQLIIRDQHDGEGIWGRWNANGPGTARLFHELGLGRNLFSSERGTGWAWNTSATGRAIFRPATERRVSREARLPTRFSHVFRRRLIYRESAARLLSIPTWHLSSEDAPASPRRRKNAVYKQRAKANEQKNANHQ